MEKKYANRLLKLAEFLEKLPRKSFDLAVWTEPGFNPKLDHKNPESCGSVACALGWATAIPSFRRLGLRLYCGVPGLTSKVVGCGRGPMSVARVIFGLDDVGYCRLFLPFDKDYPEEAVEGQLSQDATPKQVAKNIRAYVKENTQ